MGVFLLVLIFTTVVPSFVATGAGSGDPGVVDLEKNRTCDTCMAWMVEIRRAMVQEYCEGMASMWDLVIPPIGSDLRVGEAVYQRERSPLEVMTAWLLSWRIVSYPVQLLHYGFIMAWKQGLVWWRSLGAVDAAGQSWATGSDHEWDSTPLGRAMAVNQYADESGFGYLLFRASDYPHPLGVEEKGASAFEDLRVPNAAASVIGSGVSDEPKIADRRTILNFARRGLLRLLQRYRWHDDYSVLIPRPPSSTYVDSAEAAYRSQHPEVQKLEDESIGKIVSLFSEKGLSYLYKPLWGQAHLPKDTLKETAASAPPSRRGVRTLKKLEAFLLTAIADLYTQRTSIFNPRALKQYGLWSALRTDIEMCMDTIPPLRVFVEQFCVSTPNQSSDAAESKALQLLLSSDLSFGFCERSSSVKSSAGSQGSAHAQQKGSLSPNTELGEDHHSKGKEEQKTVEVFLARVERLFHYLMLKATLLQ